MSTNRFVTILAVAFGVIFVWSGINPHDYFTWMLEVFPAVGGLIVLGITYKRFQFSKLVYFLIFINMAVLVIGGKYTYALNPFFAWIKDGLHLERNYYDRLGHFLQGFVPAMIAREIIIRKSIVRSKGWTAFMIVCICLAISVFYEFVEWWVAIASGTAADAFLGTQGDVWDTQWDMFMAFTGSISALLLLTKIHDRQISRFLNDN
jgi:putative membrane protein